MAKNHKKVSISLPRELDNLLDSVVKESKKTAKPLTKSQLIAVAVYEYLENSLKVLENQKKSSKEEC